MLQLTLLQIFSNTFYRFLESQQSLFGSSQLQTGRRAISLYGFQFMLTFGLVSSIFDYLTFGVLLWFLQAGVEEFRTGWFVESVISASVIVLVVRSRRPFMRSKPSRGLLVATLAVVGLTLLLPYTPLRGPLGFVPLPASFLAALLCIVIAYVGAAEFAKKIFYRHVVY